MGSVDSAVDRVRGGAALAVQETKMAILTQRAILIG